MKRIVSYLLIILISTRTAYSQQPVTIQVTMVPPVSANLNQLLSPVNGRLMVQVLLNAQPGSSVQVKLAGKLERLSPAPLSIELSPSFTPALPITLQAGVPLILTTGQVQQSFGNLNEGNLVFTNTSPAALKDGAGYKIPEGLYRLCIVAYSMGQNVPLSNPNGGCATFSVCYKAAAPQFVQPVNGSLGISTRAIVRPASPIVFTWTAPASTCGLVTSLVDYDFEIRRVFPGQTTTDAISNPYVFQKKGLPSATFLLDTNLYKNVLQKGQSYIVRVKAYSRRGAPSVDIDNAGYSRPEMFQYGDTTGTTAPPPLTGSGSDAVVPASSASCGITPVSNTTPLAETNINNSDVSMGSFKLHVENASRKTDGSFSGSGYILWSPVPMPAPLKLAVAFSDIRINSEKVVFAGTAQTVTTVTKPAWAEVAQSKTVNELLGKLSPALSREISEFASDVQPLTKLTGLSKVELPLGLNTLTGSKMITLSILHISFTPLGTDMTVLHSLNLTEAGPDAWLSMAGTGFCIKPDGFNFSKGILYLPEDRTFSWGSGGDAMKLTLKGATKAPVDVSTGTYLSFTPGGIEKITANAELKFPRNMIVPDTDGKPATGEVSAAFRFEFLDWENWVAEGKASAFQVNGIKGLSFEPATIYYDHSQKQNPSGIVFPDGYTGSRTTAFEGLYLPTFTVSLPEGFKTFGSSKRIVFSAANMLIDENGLSGNIRGNNLVSLGTGNLGGWSFSISEIGILMVNSTISKGYFSGEFLLPVSSTPLSYNASLLKASDELAYEFTVKPADEMKMDLLLATLKLHSSSVFQIKSDPLGMAIATNLNGAVSINTGSSGVIAAMLPELSFNNMVLANRNPATKADEFYFDTKTWSFSSPPKFVGGFPVKVNKVLPYCKPGSAGSMIAGLQFDLNVDIGFGDKTIISGVTTLDISGKVTLSPKAAPKAGFNDLQVKKIMLKGDVGPVSIEGLVEFYKRDKVFGDGLKGKVAADFKIAKVDGTAQFGKTLGSDGFNYWFVDARMAFPKPVPMVGPLGIAGFGGGAFYNMSFSNDVPKGSDLSAATASLEDATPGKTISGLNFIPQRGKAGLRATIITALTEPKSFNGDVTLTAVIDMAKGSFSKFGLSGNAYFVTDYPANKNPFVQASVDASYDIPSTTFNLNATVDAKFASVKARVPIGVYADPSKWFVKVGDPFGERVSFSFLDVKNDVLTARLDANAYLAAGNVLEGGLPPMPAEVTGMAGMPASNPETAKLVSDINSRPGGGFALGAQVNGDFRASFLMLYAQAHAVLGFDLMMKHFTDPIDCGGSPGGINDWYAVGQLYAYIGADVGVHVDVWVYEGDLSLCSVEAGAILNGGLPNPYWAQGRFAVSGSVLDGLVEVHTNFEFEIGDKCYPGPSDPLKDIRIISDYGPSKADVFDMPYVVAIQPIGDVLDINIPPTESKPAGETRRFRFDIRSFTVMLNGSVLPDEGLQYSDDRTVISKRHHSIFEPNKTYTVKVVCVAEQWYPELGRWDDPYNDKTKKKEEHSEVTEFSFTTGEAPLTIPDKNVLLAYPVKGQRFLLKNEMNGTGSLKLNMWQPNILSSQRPMRWDLLFVDKNKGDTLLSSFVPDEASNTLRFKFPAGLKNQTTYEVIFWPRSPDIQGIKKDILNAGITSKVTESTRTAGSGVLVVKQRAAVAAPPKAFDQPVYRFVFATSQYNSLSEKLSASGDWRGRPTSNKFSITNTGGVPEPFDEAEIRGFISPSGKFYPSLLSVQLNWEPLKQNDQFVKDKLYTNSLVLTISGAQINLGAPEVRQEIYKPVKTVDWSRMKHLALLTVNTSMPKLDVGVSSAVTNNMASRISQLSMTPAVGTGPGISLPSVPTHNILWTRDAIMAEDFRLLKSFAQKVLAFQKNYLMLEKIFSSEAFENDTSPQLYVDNSIGGYAYIPMNKLGAIYHSTVNMNIIRTLAALNYMPLPASGSRSMQFNYSIKGIGATSINKTMTF